ncbi:TonB-dependent receptor [Novosphingobium nitrogenifigens DSM 19370]|uniref:TonB-dependent receptor n=1 Tax=Novosphingobium nitrogenifigens DSM 19370 TaxID=983920 RepID=F1ZAZ3_9SPHN|nr:TonB-dependent receptor [Novosphingobium nitrogenifigens DSM 19370]
MVAITGIAPAMAQTAGQATTPPADAPDTKSAAPQDTANQIVISGYARSITNANRIKELSTSVVEAISAEDVGKLPDVSISDALSRLPGLAVQQASGRAKYISIRGFGPDYTTATLNGRIVATVDDNRRFDYGQYPGDLFQEIDVIKTPSADLLNQGLAGTVNLQTYDPLKAKRTFSLNIQGAVGQYGALNPEASNKGYKATVVYVDRFADDTIGVSLGASAIKDPTQDYHWATGGGNGNYYGPTNPDSLGNIGPDDIQNYANSNTLYRQSGFGHVVFRPNDGFEMSLDGLYTQSKTREYSRGWELPLASWSHDTPIAGTETAQNGYVASEQWLVNPVLRNDYNTSDAKTYALGLNTKIALSSSLKLVLDASVSHATRHDNTYEIYAGTSFLNNTNPATATITRQQDGTYGVNIAGANYADPNQVSLTDPQGWGQVGFNNVPNLSDTVKNLRAELDGDIGTGFFRRWEVGVNYSDENKVSSYYGYFVCLPGAAGTSTVAGCGSWPALNGGPSSVAIPSSIINGSVTPYGVTGTSIIAINPLAAQNLLRTAPQSEASNVARDWTVRERLLTGYAQLNFDGNAGDVRIRGNIGAQIVYTNQSSTGGVATNATTVVPTYGRARYTYFLPSLNTSFEVARSTFIRFAASRTLARSKLDNENASFSVSYCGTNGCTTVPQINGKTPILQGTGGNPYIRPYFSDNVDLAVEKYFAHDQGKIALAGYYKHISNFATQNQILNTGNVNNGGPASTTTFAYDFSAYTALVTNPGQLTDSAYTTNGWASAPINDGKGSVLGFEVSAVVPLAVLTPALDGFGVIANYARTSSHIHFSNGNVITLPGLSKDVFQAQIYFEKYGFNARASYTHRGDYLGDYQLFNAQVTANLTKAQSTLDAQIGYDFKSGPLKGVSLYVQGHNLTNAKTISYVNNDPNEVNIRDQYGATYLAGMTVKFW